MRIVTLLRKPPQSTVAANSLAHGTGGVNIDASRIEGKPDMPGTTPSTVNGNGVTHGAMVRVVYVQPSGRWPANLVLQHLPGCCQTGTKTVKGTGHYPSSRPKGSDIAGATGHSGQDGLPEIHLTREQIANWVCVEGCPVNALDSQSGVLTSGQVSAHHMRNSTIQPSKGGFSGGFKDVPLTGYGDSGGASRFFKQVQTTVTHDKETQS